MMNTIFEVTLSDDRGCDEDECKVSHGPTNTIFKFYTFEGAEAFVSAGTLILQNLGIDNVRFTPPMEVNIYS